MFAEQLELMDAAELLQATLDEEGEADCKLIQLAAQEVNQQAQGVAAPR
jgi:ferritin-like metal-binding protein YciE